MAGALDFGLNDIYPNMGYLSTRTMTQPEASDQMALVDDEQAAQETSVHTAASHNSIKIGIAAILLIIILMNIRF